MILQQVQYPEIADGVVQVDALATAVPVEGEGGVAAVEGEGEGELAELLEVVEARRFLSYLLAVHVA